MSLHHLTTAVTHFAEHHESWIFLLTVIIAFLESLAIIGLFFPGTILIVTLSVVVGTIHYPFWLIWSASSLGAFLGMWCSYSFGKLHRDTVNQIWPFSKKPDMIPKVQQFFQKWGLWTLFICTFLEPLRVSVPMVSGAFELPKWRYFIVSALSAIAWSLLVLSPGVFGLDWLAKFIH